MDHTCCAGSGAQGCGKCREPSQDAGLAAPRAGLEPQVGEPVPDRAEADLALHPGELGAEAVVPRLGGMWLAVDLLLVGVFAVVGRLSHYGTLTVGGWWTTAWPFLVGTLVAWAVLVAVRLRPATVRFGGVVWLGTLVGGMVLRQVDGQGTSTPFVVVATLVLGALLVLPRIGAKLSARA